jgi:hypothetical protein
MECNQARNLEDCTCTYTACSKRGRCCACIAQHRAAGEIPGCLFTPEGEKTYDRSIQAFIRAHRGGA